MNEVMQHTLLSWVDRIASANPSVGGGSAGAVAGAQGWALIDKVQRIDKGAFANLESPPLGWRVLLLQLAEEDHKGYQRLRTARQNGLDAHDALKHSLAVSFEIGQVCLTGMQAAVPAVTRIKAVVKPDLEVAVHLLHTGCLSAIMNMEANQEDDRVDDLKVGQIRGRLAVLWHQYLTVSASWAR
ncbi:MAG: cyclodeaminase/cyclohydrolase family protein [Sulfobacillus sp.]